MIKNPIDVGGLELQFFESPDFEREDRTNPVENAVIIARNALRILMMGWRNNWQEIVSWQVFNAVFLKRDSELLRGMRLAFQQGFNHLYSQLNNRNLTTGQLNQAQLYISNCMSFLPFADINPYESIAIPQWINSHWQLVDYKVVPIELTPTEGFRKLFIEDEDRVFAYGLEPINNRDAESHLIFMGTTYPVGQGFNPQVSADLEAFETPGKFLYRSGRDKITKWMDRQGKKVSVSGISLGGVLSLLLAIDQGDKLSRVDALNCPGLYDPWLWRKNHFDHWDEFDEKPGVFIQKQGKDPVSRFGVWKKEWNLIHAIPPPSKQGSNQFIDHALNYAGFAETQFVEVDSNEDNNERKRRNFWLYTVARSLVYYLWNMPYRYFGLPVLRYVINNHKLLLSLVCLFALISFPVPILIPFITPKVSFLGISISLVIYLNYKVGIAVRTIFGLNEVKEAGCHNPKLPRNKSLDIYTNTIEESFSYKEIGAYYEIKRCLLKGKAFLPETSKTTAPKFGDLSKREVLEQSLNLSAGEKTITVTATKAKIYDIKQTIQLLNRFGLYEREALKEVLTEQQQAYSLGKHR